MHRSTYLQRPRHLEDAYSTCYPHPDDAFHQCIHGLVIFVSNGRRIDVRRLALCGSPRLVCQLRTPDDHLHASSCMCDWPSLFGSSARQCDSRLQVSRSAGVQELPAQLGECFAVLFALGTRKPSSDVYFSFSWMGLSVRLDHGDGISGPVIRQFWRILGLDQSWRYQQCCALDRSPLSRGSTSALLSKVCRLLFL